MNCSQLLHQLQALQNEVATLKSLIRDQRIIERPRGLDGPGREIKRAQWVVDLEVLNLAYTSLKRAHGEIEQVYKNPLELLREDFRLRKETSEKLVVLSEKKEVLYHAPDAIKKRLEKLSGGMVSISEDEMRRMYRVHPKVISEAEKLHMKKMKQNSITKNEKGEAEESAPLLLVLPQTLLINNKEVPFTLRMLEDKIWPILMASAQCKVYMKGRLNSLYLSSGTPGIDAIDEVDGTPLENLMDKQWGERLVAFTSAPIKGSYSRNYERQKAQVKKLFGSNSEIRADMFLAIILHYLSTGKKLIKWYPEGIMRLHEFGREGSGSALSVYWNGNVAFTASGAGLSADKFTGIGASFVFPL